LRIHLPERTITAEIAAKPLRKVRDVDSDILVIVLQGYPIGDMIAEAGLSKAPKSAKPTSW
jgi:hypothetical protein